MEMIMQQCNGQLRETDENRRNLNKPITLISFYDLDHECGSSTTARNLAEKPN